MCIGTDEPALRREIGDECVSPVVGRAAGLGSRRRTEHAEAQRIPSGANRAIEPIAVVRDAVVALHRRYMGRNPRGGFGVNAVGHGGEQHNAGNQSDLRDHGRIATALGVSTDGDLRPLGLVLQ